MKMKTKTKKRILSLFLFMVMIIGQLEVSNVSKAESVILPKDLSNIKVTPQKFVPRIGEDVTFNVNNYQFENTEIGIKNSHLISFQLFAENNPAQLIKEMKIPKFTVEKFEDEKWINNGFHLSVNARTGSYTSDGGLGTNIKEVYFHGNEEKAVVLSNEDIINGVKLHNERHNENFRLEDFRQMTLMFTRTDENGQMIHFDHDNRVVQDGPIEVTFGITDRTSNSTYATLQGYTLNEDVNGMEKSIPIPNNWLYYETSDILLEVLEPKTEYEPGDTLKIKVSIKNTSENIPNTRLVSGLDFGKKDIVKNPIKTEGKPNVVFNLPEDIGSNGLINKKTLAPQETLEFETEIKLPNDFTGLLNDGKDKLVLTPFLYTSNISQEDKGNKAYYHHEEREYNKGIELPVKSTTVPTPTDPTEPGGTIKDITIIGGNSTISNKVEEALKNFNVNRISGSNRYDTAIEVSKGYKNSDVVVLASGEKYTDELTATVLANKLNAPVLLTTKDKVLKEVIKEIERLGAKKLIIIGGLGTVSEASLKELSKYEIERIGGKDRYETSVLIGEQVRKLTGNTGQAILVDGTNFPDAIAMTSMAVEQGLPILLTEPGTLNKKTEKAVKDWGLEKVTIGGGKASVSSNIETTLKENVKVNRISGSDRYETSVLVAKQVYKNPTHAVLASGELFPDAIVSAPYAAKNGYPVLLTKSNEMPKVVVNYFNEK